MTPEKRVPSPPWVVRVSQCMPSPLPPPFQLTQRDCGRDETHETRESQRALQEAKIREPPSSSLPAAASSPCCCLPPCLPACPSSACSCPLPTPFTRTRVHTHRRPRVSLEPDETVPAPEATEREATFRCQEFCGKSRRNWDAGHAPAGVVNGGRGEPDCDGEVLTAVCERRRQSDEVVAVERVRLRHHPEPIRTHRRVARDRAVLHSGPVLRVARKRVLRRPSQRRRPGCGRAGSRQTTHTAVAATGGAGAAAVLQARIERGHSERGGGEFRERRMMPRHRVEGVRPPASTYLIVPVLAAAVLGRRLALVVAVKAAGPSQLVLGVKAGPPLVVCAPVVAVPVASVRVDLASDDDAVMSCRSLDPTLAGAMFQWKGDQRALGVSAE